MGHSGPTGCWSTMTTEASATEPATQAIACRLGGDDGCVKERTRSTAGPSNWLEMARSSLASRPLGPEGLGCECHSPTYPRVVPSPPARLALASCLDASEWARRYEDEVAARSSTRRRACTWTACSPSRSPTRIPPISRGSAARASVAACSRAVRKTRTVILGVVAMLSVIAFSRLRKRHRQMVRHRWRYDATSRKHRHRKPGDPARGLNHGRRRDR